MTRIDPFAFQSRAAHPHAASAPISANMGDPGEKCENWARNLLLLLGIALLASCARVVPEAPRAPVAPASEAVQSAVAAGVQLVNWSTIGFSREAADPAWRAFKISCPALLRRTDVSGLTRPEDWGPACSIGAEVANTPEVFREQFELLSVGGGQAFVTGYFEPQIRGSRTRIPGYDIPVYAVPPDLLDTNPLTGAKQRGRVDRNNQFVLYHERAEIEDGALAGRGLEIAWVQDAIDFFFLQIQGSGRLLLPDGQVMRIGYAGQNGREYVSVGKLLRDRNLLGPGQTSMQGITTWLRANPEQGRAVMRENKSYIFFREITGPGPLGALDVPVSPRVTVAADPRFVPLGAPVFITVDRAEASGLWIAQDTGGAIKGANRFDTFWGTGDEAAQIAGGMQARGTAFVMVPRGTLARLRAGSGPPPPR